METLLREIGASWQSALWLSFVWTTGLVLVSLAVGGAVMAVRMVVETVRTRNEPPLPPYTLIETPEASNRRSRPQREDTLARIDRTYQRAARQFRQEPPEADEYAEDAFPF